MSIAIGALILIPSLTLLFGLVLRGRLDESPKQLGSLENAERPAVTTGPRATGHRHPAGIAAAVCAAIGAPLTFASHGGAGLVA